MLNRVAAWSLLACLCTGPSIASADSVWAVVGGETSIRLERPALDEYGIEVFSINTGLNLMEAVVSGDSLTFVVDPSVSMNLTETAGQITSAPVGAIRHAGDLVVRIAGRQVVLNQVRLFGSDVDGVIDFVLAGGSKETSQPMLRLVGAKVGFDHARDMFMIEASGLEITSNLAQLLGLPKTEGLSIGSIEMVAQSSWIGGDAAVEPMDVIGVPTGGEGDPRGAVCGGAAGPDVIVGELHEIANYSGEQVGGVDYDAFSVGTYSCNVGTANLQWISGDTGGLGLHPVIGQNCYRLYTAADGSSRFEQIGQSWLKHGFFALQNDLCCTCAGGGGGSALGVGCADPYTASRNGGQSGAGPKWQVNPSNGQHIHPISNPPGYSTNTGRRLRIKVSDLNEPGALYFVEGQYVSKDDAESGNKDNNGSYRQVTMSGTGTNRTFALAGSTQRGEAGLRAWKDTDNTVTETDVQIPSDGLVIVSAQATALGGGLFHYEYAIQNLNSHRGIKGVSIPVGTGGTVSNIGFRDVPYYDGDGEDAVTRDGTDWTGQFSGGIVTWTMNDIGANSNALLWGTMYNFRFDCNRAPTTGNMTLTLFRSGSPGSVTASTVVPSSSGIIDCQPNGIGDDIDIADGTSQDCNLNGVPDECESFTTCNLALQSVASGLSQPVGVYAPPGDTSRLFIVEQTGQIKIMNLPSHSVNATPYLNLSAIVSSSGERGLLGLAFHPNWSSNGYFFVNYTNTSGNTVIARYQATGGNPASATANAASATILKTINQDFANHNGGCIQFGPDGMLYVGMGDGGSANDPNGRAQSNSSLLGKMLRLDVNNPPTYVPGDNPGSPNLPEVWAKGLRNPWRFSFDRLTGDLWIADVGQDAREEINFTAAGSPGGLNYGWRCMEGTLCTGLSGCTCNSGLVLPIRQESHGDGQGTGSISGGYVYRGCEMPWLSGSYFYADYLGNYIKRFRYVGGSVTDLQTVQAPGGAVQGIVSFGEDASGEMYVVSILGSIYKIVCDVPPPLCGNGNIDPGEQCDDGNSVPGDGCFNCQFENNDQCSNAILIADGVHAFSTVGATTDGDPHPECVVSGDGGQTFNDIWFKYVSPCSGTLTVTTCEQLGGSASYDSDLVVYDWNGSDCATRTFLACNDDDAVNACGSAGGGYHSTIIVNVAAGQNILIRVGGWNSGNSGTGNLKVSNSSFPCGECGNGIIEPGEQCDPPGPNCTQSCEFANGDCNNNGVDDGEDIAIGNSFDCNENGIPDDCESTTGETKTYVGSGAGYPAAIPDNNATGVSRSITVPDSGAITDLNVALQISHTWNGDLIVTLTHNATTVTLMNRPGGTGNNDNGYNIVLDDEGTGGAIQSIALSGDAGPVVSPPSYTPANPLSAFDSHDKSGVWTINISDRAAADTGNLVTWSLIFTNPGSPIPPCDCNGNGVTDSVDIALGNSTDCNSNGVPDDCDIAGGAPDCDGGPTGNPAAGGNLINTFCFGCHGPDGFGVNCGGGSCPGPVLRNKTRTVISKKLLPPTNHPGGAFPGFTAQDFADLEAFLNDTGHPPARPDGIIDTCQTLPDCDEDGIADGCEFGAATATDDNNNGIPDECESVLTGACCNAGSCSIETEVDCVSAGGSYLGDGVGCTPSPCPPVNDNCADAIVIVDGATPYSTVNATTDGPAEPGACVKFGDTQVHRDIWFIYTATCTGDLLISNCNATNYDSKIAVYDGDVCPTTAGAIACRDDVAGCNGNSTSLTVNVIEGNNYLIRVGGWNGAQGSGTLTIACSAYECTDASQCDDQDPCTADSCVNNQCVHEAIDSDQDGTPDCSDGCPNDPEKIAPGNCGCGVPDTAATGDMDGIGGPDGADLQLFVEAILNESTDPADLCPGDFSANGVMDLGDVPGMVNALISIP
ncbi:MAG: PQQ-dependent sugar dehydrogenase [Phycisphaerae bacterium]|nr:PQQ-dependent sugar dehydrogenase [Phycisphaerae bacterium]